MIRSPLRAILDFCVTSLSLSVSLSLFNDGDETATSGTKSRSEICPFDCDRHVNMSLFCLIVLSASEVVYIVRFLHSLFLAMLKLGGLLF